MKTNVVMSVILIASLGCSALSASADDGIASLRDNIPLNEMREDPAPLQNPTNKDIKRARAYPMQPPTIPHKIDDYQIDLKVNKCLSCHSRTRIEESQAPMISVTHFMDRDGNFLADVSPRRYFCEQCHVTQVERSDLIGNDFKDVQDLIKTKNSRQEK